MEKLTGFDLVELHDKLSYFADYHHNKGGHYAYQVIKKKLLDDKKSEVRDGSEKGVLIDEGYDKAIKEVLSLLRSTFVF